MKNLITFIVLLSTISIFSQQNFTTSLHYTREGKNTAYKAENGGMQLITNIPMSQLACKKCHSSTGLYPNGQPINPATYQPSCNDCHNFAAGTSVQEQTCLNCHKRQLDERTAYPNQDVHSTTANLKCYNCHSKQELHGDDGVAYISAKQPGAVKVKCVNCHPNPSPNTSHSIHNAKVECSVCHAVSMLTCAGCHFETAVATGKNRAINQVKDYRLLVKKDGKVHLGGFVTHSYNNKTNYIISSYTSHIIKKNATTCGDCHNNMGAGVPAINEYNNTGSITLAKWNATTKKIDGPTGVVPLVRDWKTAFKVDHVTYTGDPTVFPGDPNLWVFLKSTTDNSHLYFCEPLDSSTLAKMGVTRFPSSVEFANDNIPTQFTLKQNYPNPFNPETIIEFSIPQSAYVTLKVYDSVGNEVAELFNGERGAGNYKVNFDGKNLSSGVYYVKMTAGNYSKTIKMVLMR
ncbi:MAG: T9SS type A sorting domain-containing protein [Ignavibacterium sp.]|nr:T9SS type A sorting domain-containing protein [Ignavibacterium sp.]MCX7610768.1 T9SS type A sorting domain-containing protein [Ignavibacterium sp.]MDW8375274.1 cytochrome c3 family protein [Ignavibacteriales bacterium]